MPDKLTDNEIVKALEWCKYEYDTKCELCCYNFYSRTGCRSELRRNALDLINRLQAENEKNENIIRLADKTIATQNANIDRLNYENLQMIASIKHLKAEAYKEFANELKCRTHEISYNTMQVVNKDDIDNLLKELESNSDEVHNTASPENEKE